MKTLAEKIAEKIAGQHWTRNDQKWISDIIATAIAPLRNELANAVEPDCECVKCKKLRKAIAVIDGDKP